MATRTLELVWYECRTCGNRVAGLPDSTGWCVGQGSRSHPARRLYEMEADG